ncbi:MAG: CvpA family protein [Bacteroidales bacterium]|nr:CvpA family protein [Bacteroidales bacterium]
MNFIDIIILVFFAWFAYHGFKKGFIIELASLVALILGIYAALYLSGYAADFLIDTIHLDGKYVPVFSLIITFIVIVFLVYMLGRILEKVINMIALGFLNKLAGGIFGLLKGAVFLSIFILVMNFFSENLVSQEKKDGSLFYNPVEEIAPLLWKKMKSLDDPNIRKVEERIEEIDV